MKKLFPIWYHFLCCLILVITVTALNVFSQEYVRKNNNYKEGAILTFGDTLSIKKTIHLANELIYNTPDSAFSLYKNTLNSSLILGYSRGICMSYINMGSCYGVKGDYRKAMLFYQMAIPYFIIPGKGCEKEAIDYASNMGTAYYNLGKNDSALQYFFMGLEQARTQHDTPRIIHLYANIAGIWSANQIHEKSTQYAQHAIDLALASRNTTHLTRLYGILASNSTKLGDSLLSLQYLHKAIEHARNENQQGDVLLRMGEVYLSNSMVDSAVYYLEKWIALAQQKNTPIPLSVYSNLGNAYHMLKQDKIALRYMTKAIQLAEQPGGKAITKDFNLAVTWYNLASILRNMGRFEEAITYLLPYVDLRDSLLSTKRNAAIDSLDVLYRTAEKDREITTKLLLLSQEKEKVIRRNIWLGVTIVIALIAIATGIVLYYSFQNKQQKHQTQLRLLQQANEINLLKASIKGEERERIRIAYELHDGIGGMMAAVKMNLGAVMERYDPLAKMEEFSSLMNMLEDTSDEVRKTAHNLMPGILVNHSLSEALHIWCSNINAGGKLQLCLRMTGFELALPKDFELLLYRIVQELVQNVIKHAQAQKAEVDLARREGKIHIFVEDDGKGFDKTDEKTTEGFGLQNLRYRIQALQGELFIDSTNGFGTAISIIFDENKVKTAFTA